ncbi:MAG: hypothetical protein DMF98_24990 [Acidobacteria bacterium]|nr:MAG: hypothetical protein DMF98_24990 [Acidobacteriota bacterium]
MFGGGAAGRKSRLFVVDSAELGVRHSADRLSRFDHAAIRSPSVRAGVRVGRRCHAHASELAELRYSSVAADATGAVLRSVFANDVELVQNATTPGNGDEPGFALSVSASGRITQ